MMKFFRLKTAPYAKCRVGLEVCEDGRICAVLESNDLYIGELVVEPDNVLRFYYYGASTMLTRHLRMFLTEFSGNACEEALKHAQPSNEYACAWAESGSPEYRQFLKQFWHYLAY